MGIGLSRIQVIIIVGMTLVVVGLFCILGSMMFRDQLAAERIQATVNAAATLAALPTATPTATPTLTPTPSDTPTPTDTPTPRGTPTRVIPLTPTNTPVPTATETPTPAPWRPPPPTATFTPAPPTPTPTPNYPFQLAEQKCYGNPNPLKLYFAAAVRRGEATAPGYRLRAIQTESHQEYLSLAESGWTWEGTGSGPDTFEVNVKLDYPPYEDATWIISLIDGEGRQVSPDVRVETYYEWSAWCYFRFQQQ